MNSAQWILLTLVPSSTENQFVQAVVNSGLFAKGILFLLLLFSTISWAVILYKYFQFSSISRHNLNFLIGFEKNMADFGICDSLAERYHNGFIPRLFKGGYRELLSVSKIHNRQLLFDRPHISLVQKRMERIEGKEIIRLEKKLMFLATTANVCPFLGLLGTVWGVLGTFMTMTSLESTLTLRLIGPGISEALTTTIFGLAAAIPALVAYNYYLSRVAYYRMEMDDFMIRLESLLEKNLLLRGESLQPVKSGHSMSFHEPEQVSFE